MVYLHEHLHVSHSRKKRIRITIIYGTWVQDGVYPKQGVVFCFCFVFSSEYFSSTFFSHVPCDYQNLSFGLNPFWNFITWLHSKLSELKKESSRVGETWIHSRPPSPSFSMTIFSLLLDHFTVLFLVSVLGPEKHFSKHQCYLKCQLNPELYLGYSK